MVIHHTGGRGGGDRGRRAAAEVQAAELMRLLNRMPPKLIRPLMGRALCVIHPPHPPRFTRLLFSSGYSRTRTLKHTFVHTHACCGLEGIDFAFGSSLGQTCDSVSLFSDFFFFFFKTIAQRHPGDSVSCTSAVVRGAKHRQTDPIQTTVWVCFFHLH